MNNGSRKHTLVRLALTSVMVTALAGALVSCAPEPAPAPTPTATPSPIVPSGDGVLRIGTLFPTSGSSAFIAPAQTAGVEVAVKEINKAGGVLGKPVEVLHRNSGDASSTTAEKSFAELIKKKTDVIIGPSSSALALRLVPKLVAEKVAMIATAATAPALSTADDAGYLFRTIGADSLVGTALGQVIGKKKGVKAALVYFDDDQGEAIHSTFAKALKKAGGSIVASEKFTAKSKESTVVSAVTKAKPDVVVLASPFSAMSQNKAIITGLVAAKLGGDKLWLANGSMADYSQALPKGKITKANGILAGTDPDKAFKALVKAADPKVTDYRYAAEAYDATILAALAASSAGDDSGESIARTLQSVSENGIKCLSYGECLDVLKTRTDIDYDGVTGPITFDVNGDPQQVHFGLYTYNAENKFSLKGTTTVK